MLFLCSPFGYLYLFLFSYIPFNDIRTLDLSCVSPLSYHKTMAPRLIYPNLGVHEKYKILFSSQKNKLVTWTSVCLFVFWKYDIKKEKEREREREREREKGFEIAISRWPLQALVETWGLGYCMSLGKFLVGIIKVEKMLRGSLIYFY